MFSIIAGILGVLLQAIGAGFNTRALKTSSISPELFKLCCYFFNLPVIIILLYIQGGWDSVFLENGIYFCIIFIGTIFAIASTLMNYHVLRNTKVSDLLPYRNLDKVFIVIIGFLLYYG
ncbi:hypothetical protein MK079_04630, partial [Candidatus Gracilibacteria bacterium]|nr:hypothetical protein [Candidatus Gracilibacteria bacterium]